MNATPEEIEYLSARGFYLEPSEDKYAPQVFRRQPSEHDLEFRELRHQKFGQGWRCYRWAFSNRRALWQPVWVHGAEVGIPIYKLSTVFPTPVSAYVAAELSAWGVAE